MPSLFKEPYAVLGPTIKQLSSTADFLCEFHSIGALLSVNRGATSTAWVLLELLFNSPLVVISADFSVARLSQGPMRFPFPSRARLKPPPPAVPTKRTIMSSRRYQILPDVLSTSLLALRESVDAFPPLKSVVGGVMAVWDIAQRAKYSKSEAREIAWRTTELLGVIADAVPDPSAIPPAMLKSTDRFTILLDRVRDRVESIAMTISLTRILHLN